MLLTQIYLMFLMLLNIPLDGYSIKFKLISICFVWYHFGNFLRYTFLVQNKFSYFFSCVRISFLLAPACNAGDQGLILGLGDPLEKGMATHSSILARRIPWTGQSGRLQSMGSQRIRHNWVANTFTSRIYLGWNDCIWQPQISCIKCNLPFSSLKFHALKADLCIFFLYRCDYGGISVLLQWVFQPVW